MTGEAGIGKTCLVSAFVSSSTASSRASIGHAQCIELYGTSEPYLPIFEAMQRLGAEIGVDKLAIYLKSFAPTWLAQMPWLSDGAQPPADVAGATPQRMLRELAQALEAMSAARPIVLWLEDLHWSDRSTLDAISFLARRPESARLMVIGSYRPAEARARRHPVQAVKEADRPPRCVHRGGIGLPRAERRRVLPAGPLRARGRRSSASFRSSSTGAPTATRCSPWR